MGKKKGMKAGKKARIQDQTLNGDIHDDDFDMAAAADDMFDIDYNPEEFKGSAFVQQAGRANGGEPVSRKGKRRSAEAKDEETDIMESRYEKKRSFGQFTGTDLQAGRKLLPVVDPKTGKRITKVAEEEKDLAEEHDDDAVEEDEERQSQKKQKQTAREEDEEAPKSLAELIAMHKTKVGEGKGKINRLGQEIMMDPEKNLDSLEALASMIRDVKQPVIVRRLAIASLAQIYADIIPQYRIRELTEMEKATKVSKDVLKLRRFEQGLLRHYQNFLQTLYRLGRGKEKESKEHRRKGKRGREAQAGGNTPEDDKDAILSMRKVILRAYGKLLVEHYDFNYRNNLIAELVHFGGRAKQEASSDAKDLDDTGRVCSGFLIQLMRSDINGEASLEAVKAIAAQIKSSNYRSNPLLLLPLYHLRISKDAGDMVRKLHPVTSAQSLTSEDREKQKEIKKAKLKALAKGKGQHISKKQRKMMKQKRELEKEMKDAQLMEDTGKQKQIHTTMIKLAFLTFFRVIKNAADSALLDGALRGLGKYAHLISVDFFADVMTVLRRLLREPGTMIQSQKQKDIYINEAEDQVAPEMHASRIVATAFAILSGQGRALNLDLTDFMSHLYQELPEIASEVRAEARVESNVTNTANLTSAELQSQRALEISEALDGVLHILASAKVAPPPRAGAMARRLLQIAAIVPNSGIAVIAAVAAFTLLRRFGGAASALLAEPGGSLVGSGYMVDVDDPEHCDALGTPLWEDTILVHHYHPTLRIVSRHSIASLIAKGGTEQAQQQRKDQLAAAEANVGLRPLDFSSAPSRLLRSFDAAMGGFNPAVTKPGAAYEGFSKKRGAVQQMERYTAPEASRDLVTSLMHGSSIDKRIAQNVNPTPRSLRKLGEENLTSRVCKGHRSFHQQLRVWYDEFEIGQDLEVDEIQ
eukprot:Clim_evm8s48 gene=Clim_evmTU8s48